MLAALVQERRTAEAKGQKGIALVYEIPMRCKDGGQVWMEISTTPFYDDGGAIIGFQGVGRDISERKRRELYLLESQHQMENHLHDVEEEKSKLQEQVVRDPLTGVFNRRFLDDMLPLELSRAAREGYPVAIIMLDLDHFKRVNDRYSHAAGDEVLKSFTALLRQGARDSDMVCRYGGEEFVVIMPRMSVERAVERVNAWRAELQVMVIAYGDDRIRVSVSGGISGFPRDGETSELLLARADEMLYFSKREGRNRITVYGNVNDNRSKLLL
jgi:diguanylate cyclase (GGDEF)-like protein